MTHAPTPLKLRATTAICAVLALGSTPAWAQDAAPVLDAPAASVPAQSTPAQPTIVLPEAAPAAPPPAATAPTMVSEPVVQQPPSAPPPVAVTPAEEAAPARRMVERPAAARTAPAAQPAAAPVAAAPSQPASVAVAPAPIAPAPVSAAPEPVAPLPVAQPESRTVDVVDGDSALGAGALAALLVALGLGGIAVAMRSRRHRRLAADREVYQTQPAQAYAPIPAPQPALEPAAPLPAFATADDFAEAETTRRAIGEEELATAAPHTTPVTARATPLPDGPVPQTREERDALLDRMISAPPSAENPFTSRKARLRRARIILQSREIDERNNAAQPFDWRTYKPSASTPTPATPPRVTA